jgi:glycerol-3-phosphate acyltransferase PlsX
MVAGAVQAVYEFGHHVTLLGDRDKLKSALEQCCAADIGKTSADSCLAAGCSPDSYIDIVHTSQVVGMDESPLEALRQKKDSSILVAFKLLKEGKVDAVVSAGNSGATMAAAVKTVGRLPGIARPGIAGIFPTLKKPLVMMDVGANVDCRPKHLMQFGAMASAFSNLLFEIEKPRVGLLSIGEEGGKGNALVKGAHEILSNSSLNYIGNVEGRDIFQGNVDVMVCDGFVGNVCLKLSEGLAEAMVAMLREEFAKNIKAKVGYLLTKKAYASLKKRTDYAEYGGAPLLGLRGIGII